VRSRAIQDVSEFTDISAEQPALRARMWEVLNRTNLELYMHHNMTSCEERGCPRTAPGESTRPGVESPWSHFTSECQRFGHPPRLDKQPFCLQVARRRSWWAPATPAAPPATGLNTARLPMVPYVVCRAAPSRRAGTPAATTTREVTQA
jgi:hypothetical protein